MRKIIRSWSISAGLVVLLFGLTGICSAQSSTSQNSTKPDSTDSVPPPSLASVPTPSVSSAGEQRSSTAKTAPVILFERPGAPGIISADKLRQSLKLAAQELHTPGDIPPGTIVFHIAESEEELFGINRTSIWQTTGRDGGIRYEIWIVGEPKDEDYSKLAVVLLEHHFNVSLDPTEGKRVALAVTKNLNGMVSAEELGFHKPTIIESTTAPAQAFLATAASYSEKRSPVICHP